MWIIFFHIDFPILFAHLNVVRPRSVHSYMLCTCSELVELPFFRHPFSVLSGTMPHCAVCDVCQNNILKNKSWWEKIIETKSLCNIRFLFSSSLWILISCLFLSVFHVNRRNNNNITRNLYILQPKCANSPADTWSKRISAVEKAPQLVSRKSRLW